MEKNNNINMLKMKKHYQLMNECEGQAILSPSIDMSHLTFRSSRRVARDVAVFFDVDEAVFV